MIRIAKSAAATLLTTLCLAGVATAADLPKHKFITTFEDSAIPGMEPIVKRLRDGGEIKSLMDALGQELPLPQDVPVTFKDCKLANAFWNPEDRSVTYCYELVNFYAKGVDKLDMGEDVMLRGLDANAVVMGTTIFVLFHELGHGLIDMYKLPSTGREEDAVDQFATVLLIEADDKKDPFEQRASRFALLGAYFFKRIAVTPNSLSRDIFSDEHALGQQRYYDVMCLVLGSDDAAWGPVITPGVAAVEAETEKDASLAKDADRLQKRLAATDAQNILPYQRAARCEDEYKKYSRSWEELVDTYATKAVASPKR